MKYGIFADVHSNLEALNAVLDFFRATKVDAYLFAGDIVGYGPNPNECVQTIKRLFPMWICVGNHDRAACGLKDITWFNEYAQKALIWTRQNLSQDNQIYISELPKIVYQSEFTVVHGSPRDPLDEYLLTRDQYAENKSSLKMPFTYVGHTHIPFIFGEKFTQIFMRDKEAVTLSKKDKYIINPGSVGQPRDGNSKASCAVFDNESCEYEHFRIKYDFPTTQEKMRKERLPVFLIERLYWGK
ncbi:MAG: metallophosphoesterase family protein [Elusimicrobiota bacterium]